MPGSARPSILVIEDDLKTADTVALYLRHAGYRVTVSRCGREGLELATRGGHCLIVLDRMLPGVEGLEVCRAVREHSRVPIVMLTARAQERERVVGLEAGADDYIVKPFSPRELVARVRAILRRVPDAGVTDAARAGAVLRLGPLRIDPASREVRVGSRRPELTPTEFRLLETLARAPNRVFTRAELCDRALDPDPDRSDRTIDAHVKNLRRKLESDPSRPAFVRTVFGVGYKLTVEAA